MMQNLLARLFASTTSTPMDTDFPNYESTTFVPVSSAIVHPTFPVPSMIPNSTILPHPSPSGTTGSVTDIPNNLRSHEFSREDERKLLCKMARNRRMSWARQRRLGVSRQSPPEAFLTPTSSRDTDATLHRLGCNIMRSELYTFSAFNGTRLRLLLTKELKSSDVSSLGRIVLPKREVEERLPILHHKEGILLILKDIHSDKVWKMRFKYWCNNRTRMYVLESTGEFVRHEGLQVGDAITLYEDQQNNLYISKNKREQPNFRTVFHETRQEQNGMFNTQVSLAPNDFIASSSQNQVSQTENDCLNDDDFYGGLDILPELNKYDYFCFINKEK